MKAFFIKANNALHPASFNDQEILKHFKTGQPVSVELKRVRNYEFHKKWFALVGLAFDYWEPPDDGYGSAWKEKIVIEKNFERFRKDITIKAGYFEATYRLNGDVRIEAKSISFASMSEDEFEELYANTIDVIIKNIMTQYDGDMLRSLVEQVEAFE